jgi:light-harvesting complex I chlorophyll a/b binding protein 1
MLATLGFVVSGFYHLPGEIYNVNPIAAHDAAVKSGAMSQILLWTSLLELVSAKAVAQMFEGSGRAPGDFGFDPLKFSAGKPDSVKQDLAMKELANGRLAMLAFSGLVTQAVLTGGDFPYAN